MANFIKIEAHYLRPGDTVLRPSEDGDAMRSAEIANIGRNTMGVVRLRLSERASDVWVVGNGDKVFAVLGDAR
ncbi:MAG: hypothetical protein RLZZ393_811 [Pseudomonadota bacterium]|jgi:hypothetical protein